MGNTPIEQFERDTVTVSECCNFHVYASTPDDFHKIHIKNSKTGTDLVMTVNYICNKCGNYCTIKEIPRS